MQIDKLFLHGLYLTLFGSTFMDRTVIINELEKLGYNERKEKVSHLYSWSKFRRLPLEPFDLGTFLRKKLDAAVVDLILKLTKYDPNGRCTLEDALKHDYFRDV